MAGDALFCLSELYIENFLRIFNKPTLIFLIFERHSCKDLIDTYNLLFYYVLKNSHYHRIEPHALPRSQEK